MSNKKGRLNTLNKENTIAFILPSILLCIIAVALLIIVFFNMKLEKSILNSFIIISEYKIIFFYLPIFFISSALAIYSSLFNKKHIHYITKPLATFLLIIIASYGLRDQSRIDTVLFIMSGLTFSLIGDVFMMFMDSNRFFKLGLFSFLLAHIIYGVCFFYLKNTFQIYYILLLIPLIISGFLFIRLFLEKLKKELFSISLYMIIISFMVWSSYIVVFSNFNINTLILAIGATLFYSSDAIISYERFVRKLKHGEFFVLSLYFSAQIFIAIFASNILS